MQLSLFNKFCSFLLSSLHLLPLLFPGFLIQTHRLIEDCVLDDSLNLLSPKARRQYHCYQAVFKCVYYIIISVPSKYLSLLNRKQTVAVNVFLMFDWTFVFDTLYILDTYIHTYSCMYVYI